MTLLPDAVAQLLGQWGPTSASYPVALADIQRWAMNVYAPEQPPRLFWDEEYATGTRWGGIIAPQEFNPFAWAIVDNQPDHEDLSAILKRVGFSVLNGGQADKFGVPMRPADVISARSRLVECQEKATRFGPTLFLTSENEWTNQNGELVRSRRSTIVAHRASAAAKVGAK